MHIQHKKNGNICKKKLTDKASKVTPESKGAICLRR